MNENFNLEAYNFYLPKDLIAQTPNLVRCESKLFVYNRSNNEILHVKFKDIIDLINKDWFIVLNNTRVERRRIFCKKTTGGLVSILITYYKDCIFKAITYKNIKIGQILILPNGIKCVAKEKDIQTDEVLFEGNFKLQDIKSLIENFGLPPLPPYIKRTYYDERTNIDIERYQTVYAKDGCSLAAPTAGFHFDEKTLDKFIQKGIEILYIKLDIGLSTFKPIRKKNILEHKILPEQAYVDSQTAEKINEYLKTKKLLCVGTTVVRVLEYLATKFGRVKEYCGDVDLYIYPGYDFKITSGIVTNFHLPKSTNLLLVASFIGREKLLELYKIAIEKKYKFYSYGDAMLII